MENKNMELWESVYKTDPDYMKTGKVDGRVQTSIVPMYLIKKLTEQFGMAGDGWGYEIKEDRFDQAAPVLSDKNELLYHNVVHTLMIEFWYVKDGEKKYISQYGHTPFVRPSKYGAMTDWEAPKKSLTDALKKAISLLGFGSDVFMGDYEDSDYVNAVSSEMSIEKAINKEEEADRQREQYLTEMKGYADVMQSALSIHELNAVYKKAMRVATYRNDANTQKRLTEIKDEKLNSLKEGKNNG